MRIVAGLLTLAILSTAAPQADAALAPNQQAAEIARQVAEDARQRTEVIRQQADVVRQQADSMRIAGSSSSTSDAAYSAGLGSLQQRQYDRAISQFDQSVVRQAPRADGALYWRAFAQYKLGRTQDAITSLAQLRRDHAQSRYLNDAKVLEADARRSSGGSATAAQDDEEIKLLAVQGIQRSAQAVPVLEGVLAATNSLAVKKRALSSLSAVEDPRARPVLLGIAKGGGNPDLQIEAIRLLAARRDAPMTEADLQALYSSGDTAIRTSVIAALASQNNADALVALARRETSLDLKREIVRRLSDMAPRSKVAADFLTGVLQ